MPIPITLPRLGWSMEEGTFLEWLKKTGDFVNEGDPLFTLESDKAAQEVESTDSGILELLPDGPKPGAVIKVGAILAYLLAEGEPSQALDATPETTSLTPPVVYPQGAASVHSAQPVAVDATKATTTATTASPRARRAALATGVDLATVTPTGKSGRIRERDVLDASSKKRLPSVGWVDVPVTAPRRIIAEKLERSVSQTVPVTITGRCDASAMVLFRNQLKAGDATPLPSFNDIILKIAAGVLKAHPNLTGRWAGTSIQLPDAIDIGFAVETEDGLVVPVLRDPGSLRLSEISSRSKQLIDAARNRLITSLETQDGCFTITSLGSFGVDTFTPVIQFPETAILGVGAITRVAIPLEDGSFVRREQLPLSLTFDHRALDGAPAARFLQTLRRRLENPTAWI